jgi:hypothetical protein
MFEQPMATAIKKAPHVFMGISRFHTRELTGGGGRRV